MDETGLKPFQKDALAFIEKWSEQRSQKVLPVIEEIRKMSNLKHQDLDLARENLKNNVRVALHFHPDRLITNHLTVVESMFHQGYYSNQFDTGISNGMLAPLKGGLRDEWETNLFGMAYKDPGMPAFERPKYGGLDLLRDGYGPCPRFGSCYFLLKTAVSHRSTFTYRDSYLNPAQRGTLNIFDDILASLLLDCFEKQEVLGVRNFPPGRLIDFFLNYPQEFERVDWNSEPCRNLDFYVEAQVHGMIGFANDVEYLVADPSFINSDIEHWMLQLCERYRIKLHWHRGYRLEVKDVPDDFRGPTMPSLALRVAEKGILDARTIGKAAQEVRLNPEHWTDRGTADSCLQELKLLWHVLVKFGSFYDGSANL